jgi:hypothetical protein
LKILKNKTILKKENLKDIKNDNNIIFDKNKENLEIQQL